MRGVVRHCCVAGSTAAAMNVAPFGDTGQRHIQAYVYPMSSYKPRDAFHTRCEQCQSVMYQCSSCKRKDDADFTAAKKVVLKRQRVMKASAEQFDQDLDDFEPPPPIKSKSSTQPSSQAVTTPQPTSQPVKSVKAPPPSQPTPQPVSSGKAAPPGRPQRAPCPATPPVSD